MTMEGRITVRCQACGETENCGFFCELTLDNIIDVNELLCPVTGEEAEWYEVKSTKAVTDKFATKRKILKEHRVEYSD